jgi:SPP1 gp7 family putative phage head morphogenesis protein
MGPIQMTTMTTLNKPNQMRGGVLTPSAAIQIEYSSAILALVRRMCDETKRVMKAAFTESVHHAAQDAKERPPVIEGLPDPEKPPKPEEIREFIRSLGPRTRIELNHLMLKYEKEFSRTAKKATKRMVARTLKSSSITLGLSLRDLSEKLTLSTDVFTDQLQEVVQASTAEAVSLIKLIPQKYLAEVQGAVSRSITSGNGLQDLVPFLNKKYDQNIRHARNVSMDQTRKAYSNINAARMQAIGVREYEWVHTGGSVHPRENHQRMNGKVFSLDDPPVIGEMYGEEVRGKPGDLPFCRCVLRQIIKFEE